VCDVRKITGKEKRCEVDFGRWRRWVASVSKKKAIYHQRVHTRVQLQFKKYINSVCLQNVVGIQIFMILIVFEHKVGSAPIACSQVIQGSSWFLNLLFSFHCYDWIHHFLRRKNEQGTTRKF